MSISAPRSDAVVNLSVRASRTSRVGFAVVGGLVTALFMVASIAFGHAELATVQPADKSTVQGPPEEIVMTFTQNLDSQKSSIRLVDAAGNLVVQGGIVTNGREMYLPLEGPLPVGAYEIRWTTFSSEDQESDHGTTTFTVAAALSVAPSPATASPSAAASVAPSAAPSVAPAPSPSSPPSAPAGSSSDAVIPVVVALIVLAGLGMWLLRGRARAR
jgi:methionine-rich copper-binding protein CopC